MKYRKGDIQKDYMGRVWECLEYNANRSLWKGVKNMDLEARIKRLEEAHNIKDEPEVPFVPVVGMLYRLHSTKYPHIRGDYLITEVGERVSALSSKDEWRKLSITYTARFDNWLRQNNAEIIYTPHHK